MVEKLPGIKQFREFFDKIFQKIPWPNINPSILTVGSLIPAILVALSYPDPFWVWLWSVLLLFMDLADGAIAKKYKKESRFGYLMDLWFDRITETIVLIPFLLHLNIWLSLLILNWIFSVISVKSNRHISIPLRQAYAVYAFILIFTGGIL